MFEQPTRRGFLQVGVGAALGLLAPTAGSMEPAAKDRNAGGGFHDSPPMGPLRVHPDNPRYFADASGKAVYLTGSHTWANLIDRGPSDPPPEFDFNGYLDFLEKHHHNFIRLWARHVSWYHDYGEQVLHAAPLAWPRSGPGEALDRKPKFDLGKLNQDYFDRLRSRVSAARDRRIYVSIMLFGGSYECRGGWRGNPFHAQNNINGIDGDPGRDGEGLEAHTLDVPAINRIQEAYVRKVIDTVNDLDNVLYEISNEGDDSSVPWQFHLIRFIRDYEAKLPQQHPVGMTAIWSGIEGNPTLSRSPADWISPQTDGLDIPVSDDRKVSLLDSDHWFVRELYGDPAFGGAWVWKAFCRGHQPILMEHLPPQSLVMKDHPLSPEDSGYVASRSAMGQTRRLADKMDLAKMKPSGALASSGHCLANPGSEYVVYFPKGSPATLDLSEAKGEFAARWYSTVSDENVSADAVSGGARREFTLPFAGDAVLHLRLAE